MATRVKRGDLYSVVIALRDERELQRVLALPGIDVGCRHPNLRREAGRIELPARVPGALLPKLQRDRNLAVRVIENATEAGKRYLEQVGRGNRFKGARVAPRGLGKLV